MKVFHVRDGQGLVMWHQAGFRSGIISGRKSNIVVRRAKELGVDFIKQGSSNKILCFEEILEKAKVSAEEVAYIGDDIPDIVLLEKVGFPITVADAEADVFPFVTFITESKGGCGAVREITNLLLKSKKMGISEKTLKSA